MSTAPISPALFLPPADAAIWHATSGGSTRAASSAHSARVAGALLILASVGFLLVFAWLAAHFGYPDVLDQPARVVLPALQALGPTGRGVWAVYAVLPLLLIPAVTLLGPALARDPQDAPLLQTARALQVVSSLAMTIGLARWSTLQWVLAERRPTLSADGQATLDALSDALNRYLGNALGEFVGELALYGVFAALSLALWRRGVRWLALFGAATTLAGWIGMFRNITPAVDDIAAISNGLLPAFLIVLGLRLMWRRV